jgi:hypothetical protein
VHDAIAANRSARDVLAAETTGADLAVARHGEPALQRGRTSYLEGWTHADASPGDIATRRARRGLSVVDFAVCWRR